MAIMACNFYTQYSFGNFHLLQLAIHTTIMSTNFDKRHRYYAVWAIRQLLNNKKWS